MHVRFMHIETLLLQAHLCLPCFAFDRAQLHAYLHASPVIQAGAAGAHAFPAATPAAPSRCLTGFQQPANPVHWLCRSAANEPDSPTPAPAACGPRAWGAVHSPFQASVQGPLADAAGSSMDVDLPAASTALSGGECPAGASVASRCATPAALAAAAGAGGAASGWLTMHGISSSTRFQAGASAPGAGAGLACASAVIVACSGGAGECSGGSQVHMSELQSALDSAGHFASALNPRD